MEDAVTEPKEERRAPGVAEAEDDDSFRASKGESVQVRLGLQHCCGILEVAW